MNCMRKHNGDSITVISMNERQILEIEHPNPPSDPIIGRIHQRLLDLFQDWLELQEELSPYSKTSWFHYIQEIPVLNKNQLSTLKLLIKDNKPLPQCLEEINFSYDFNPKLAVELVELSLSYKADVSYFFSYVIYFQIISYVYLFKGEKSPNFYMLLFTDLANTYSSEQHLGHFTAFELLLTDSFESNLINWNQGEIRMVLHLFAYTVTLENEYFSLLNRFFNVIDQLPETENERTELFQAIYSKVDSSTPIESLSFISKLVEPLIANFYPPFFKKLGVLCKTVLLSSFFDIYGQIPNSISNFFKNVHISISDPQDIPDFPDISTKIPTIERHLFSKSTFANGVNLLPDELILTGTVSLLDSESDKIIDLIIESMQIERCRDSFFRSFSTLINISNPDLTLLYIYLKIAHHFMYVDSALLQKLIESELFFNQEISIFGPRLISKELSCFREIIFDLFISQNPSHLEKILNKAMPLYFAEILGRYIIRIDKYEYQLKQSITKELLTMISDLFFKLSTYDYPLIENARHVVFQTQVSLFLMPELRNKLLTSKKFFIGFLNAAYERELSMIITDLYFDVCSTLVHEETQMMSKSIMYWHQEIIRPLTDHLDFVECFASHMSDLIRLNKFSCFHLEKVLPSICECLVAHPRESTLFYLLNFLNFDTLINHKYVLPSSCFAMLADAIRTVGPNARLYPLLFSLCSRQPLVPLSFKFTLQRVQFLPLLIAGVGKDRNYLMRLLGDFETLINYSHSNLRALHDGSIDVIFLRYYKNPDDLHYSGYHFTLDLPKSAFESHIKPLLMKICLKHSSFDITSLFLEIISDIKHPLHDDFLEMAEEINSRVQTAISPIYYYGTLLPFQTVRGLKHDIFNGHDISISCWLLFDLPMLQLFDFPISLITINDCHNHIFEIVYHREKIIANYYQDKKKINISVILCTKFDINVLSNYVFVFTNSEENPEDVNIYVTINDGSPSTSEFANVAFDEGLIEITFGGYEKSKRKHGPRTEICGEIGPVYIYNRRLRHREICALHSNFSEIPTDYVFTNTQLPIGPQSTNSVDITINGRDLRVSNAQNTPLEENFSSCFLNEENAQLLTSKFVNYKEFSKRQASHLIALIDRLFHMSSQFKDFIFPSSLMKYIAQTPERLTYSLFIELFSASQAIKNKQMAFVWFDTLILNPTLWSQARQPQEFFKILVLWGTSVASRSTIILTLKSYFSIMLANFEYIFYEVKTYDMVKQENIYKEYICFISRIGNKFLNPDDLMNLLALLMCDEDRDRFLVHLNILKFCAPAIAEMKDDKTIPFMFKLLDDKKDDEQLFNEILFNLAELSINENLGFQLFSKLQPNSLLELANNKYLSNLFPLLSAFYLYVDEPMKSVFSEKLRNMKTFSNKARFWYLPVLFVAIQDGGSRQSILAFIAKNIIPAHLEEFLILLMALQSSYEFCLFSEFITEYIPFITTQTAPIVVYFLVASVFFHMMTESANASEPKFVFDAFHLTPNFLSYPLMFKYVITPEETILHGERIDLALQLSQAFSLDSSDFWATLRQFRATPVKLLKNFNEQGSLMGAIFPELNDHFFSKREQILRSLLDHLAHATEVNARYPFPKETAQEMVKNLIKIELGTLEDLKILPEQIATQWVRDKYVGLYKSPHLTKQLVRSTKAPLLASDGFKPNCQLITPLSSAGRSISLPVEKAAGSRIYISNSFRRDVLFFSDIQFIYKRSLPGSIELYLEDGRTFLVSFSNSSMIKKYFPERLLTNIEYLDTNQEAREKKIKRVSAKWKHCMISTFEYLMELNTLFGKTYNSVADYPIMPPVLADIENYHSKPDYELLEPPTGYPSIDRTLFRIKPESEKSIADETIGKLYILPEWFYFFEVVRDDDVLPKWAKNKFEFVYKMRQRLEKAHIEKWIDRVFPSLAPHKPRYVFKPIYVNKKHVNLSFGDNVLMCAICPKIASSGVEFYALFKSGQFLITRITEKEVNRVMSSETILITNSSTVFPMDDMIVTYSSARNDLLFSFNKTMKPGKCIFLNPVICDGCTKTIVYCVLPNVAYVSKPFEITSRWRVLARLRNAIHLLKMKENFHIAVFATIDSLISIYCTNSSKLIRRYAMEKDHPVDLIITDKWGFIVVRGEKTIVTLSVSGLFIASANFKKEVTYWFTFSSRSERDFVGIVLTDGSLWYFEAMYPSKMIQVDGVNSNIVCATYDYRFESFFLLGANGIVDIIQHNLDQ